MSSPTPPNFSAVSIEDQVGRDKILPVRQTVDCDGYQEPVWVTAGYSDDTPILVRAEYHNGLKAILEWRTNCLRAGQGLSVQILINRDSHFGENLAKDLPYPSPFQGDQEPPKSKMWLSVVGMPGIGKSHFLLYIWNLRRAGKLPTLYIAGKTDIRLFVNGQEYSGTTAMWRVPLYDRHLSGGWCLIDSNEEQDPLPRNLLESSLFVIQAASPREKHFSDRKKRSGIKGYYYMKEWTVKELLLGYLHEPIDSSLPDSFKTTPFRRHFQSFEQSPNYLKYFFALLGGSAREAFSSEFLSPDDCYQKMNEDLQNLEDSKLRDIWSSKFNAHTMTNSIEEGISHKFFSVFPYDDDIRSKAAVRTPSDKILDMIITEYDRRFHQKKVDIFSQYLIAAGVGSRSMAAELYDTHFHEYLLRLVNAGSVQVRAMKPPSKPRQSATQKNREWSTSDSLSTLAMPGLIALLEFDHDTVLDFRQLEYKYLKPTIRYFATFHSLLILSETSVIAFQATIADKHDCRPGGLEWLTTHGIEEIHYVYVSPAAVEHATVVLPGDVPDDLIYPAASSGTLQFRSVSHMYVDFT
ncbi:hypothetical protein F5051DRAFT_445001 [Lentinula edodes]|nr:hypothetical protein F5051DRAFT_445001 [Lentinula edodes]